MREEREMGFFSGDEIRGLKIANMILHVVGGDDEFEPQPLRPVEHEAFFIARILDTDAEPVHKFDPQSATKLQVERIASGVDAFEAGAQSLSRIFSKDHVGSSRDGAFFIFEMTTADPAVRIYSMVKYDYREAIEQTDGDALRRIVHAFIADRKAIQKAALMRVVGGVADPLVAAKDRVKQAPDIGDYFANFLDVARSRNDKELNNSVVEALRKALTSSKEMLPGRDVAAGIRNAKRALHDRQIIDEEAIADAVLTAAGSPEDEATRSKLISNAKKAVHSAKLDGLSFRPDRQILRLPPMRKLKTTEGVTLLYPDDADGTTVTRAPRQSGGETITIVTQEVTEDSVVGNSSRGAA
ncbi:hypothetical protein M2322_003168 [Rhodoblastus acidophilus]|uniref:hypothetical protein n=1 Tax=Rhodoblastus acidophilus TaxID=1074 RepID=UPI002224ABB8|nr:hypothetical protein [Rhodoblastus acidophilus]MCW2317604.1 hypothetical protein [Rhodoblastus acidophilus]